MKKFLAKVTIFIALNIGILAALLFASNYAAYRYTYKAGETESNLLITPRNQSFDIVLLGTSHGKTFTRFNNEEVVQKIIGKRMLNLSKGSGAGLLPEKIFLENFYERGNDTRQIVYFIDPWVFFSPKWNENNFFPTDEPFDVEFFSKLVQNHISVGVILNYLKTKVEPNWFMQYPEKATQNSPLQAVDKEAVELRLKNLYQDGINQKNFNKYKKNLDGIIELAKIHKTKITFIVPPTLLGPMPGEGQIADIFSDGSYGPDVAFFDFSLSLLKPELYYNHDHLSEEGVACFASYFLKPIVDTNKNIINIASKVHRPSNCQ